MIEDFSDQALAQVARPGGYTTMMKPDPLTGLEMNLELLEVPLELAEHILWAHSDAKVIDGDAKGWEATLADLASDLLVRCSELEQRLKGQS